MGIFDNLFGKNKKVEERNASERVLSSADVHLSDLISDWFNDSKINAGDFQTNFLDKCMQIYQSDPRLAVYFQNQPEQSKITYQTNLALLFLAAHAPNQVFMERVIRSIFDRNSAHYHISEFLKTPKFSEGFKNHPDLKRTLLLGSANFKNYHAAVLRLDANFSMLSSIISTLSSFKFDTEPYNFTHALQFVHCIDFKEKTFVLLYVFIHKHINHREKKAEETQVHDSEILSVLELSLAKFNEDFNQSITMQDLTAFGEAVYGIKFSQKWIDTDYKNQKSLKADDIPTLSIYLNSLEDSHIAITLLVAGLAAIYISDNETKIYSTLLKKLMVKLSPDSIWAEKLFSLEIGSNNVFSEEHIFIPIFEKLIPSLSFDHPLRQIFERMILQQSGYGFRVPNKKAIALLDKLCETITDSNLKNFCHLRYSSVYGNASIHQERLQRFQINLHFEDKSYSTLKALVSELNKIIPCTLMNVAKQGTFYSENARLFTLHTDGADIEFTANFLMEINQLLVTKKTGMRLIPIPLQIFQGRDGLRCVFAAAFLNKSQFNYLTEIYFEQHFPSIKEFNVGEFLSDVSFEGMDAPSLHERSLNSTITGNDNSENNFKNNPDWQWFKERYIDTLSSNLEWYELMTTLIAFPESKKLLKDWTSKIHAQIHAFGEERFSRELSVLINSSIKEDFWFFDNYAIGLKGIMRASAALGTDASFTVVKTIVEAAYTKVGGVGPRATAIGNFGLDALAMTGKQGAFGILNIMRNKSKYQRFIKAIDKYIELFKGQSDEPEELLADKSIPKFGFKDGQKIIEADEVKIRFAFEKGKLVKYWQQNGQETKTAPADFKLNHPKLEKEIQEEFKQINSVFKDLRHRIKSYWINNRLWNAADWNEYLYNHDLILPWIENMIWRNQTQGIDFIIQNNKLICVDRTLHMLSDTDDICLWHPAMAKREEIEAWQNRILEDKIQQPEKQAFREHYPFSENESRMTESPRFNGHFLEVNKLMALANTSGWIFTYVHEDVSWPRTFLKGMNLTAHLRCDYNRSDFAIPTKMLFFTDGNTTKINFKSKFEPLEFDKIPAVTRSEICRDVDLFIAITSVANNPSLSEKNEILGTYRNDFMRGTFSENGTSRIRKEIIQKLIPILGIKSSGFENNYLLVTGKVNEYRINLGSGFAQIRQTQEHLNLIPDMSAVKRNKKITLPFEDDETLNIILAKALMLQNDDQLK